MTAEAQLIVCAGIPRSGSTWLYNAVRLVMQRAHGESNVYGTWVDRYDTKAPAPIHVVKTHDRHDDLASRAGCVLTSRRDVRDIAASAWKRGWIGDHNSALEFVDKVVAQHEFWQPRARHETIYERMRRDSCAELAAISRALAIDLDSDALKMLDTEIAALGHDDASAEDFDAANLMHKRHIMDGRVGYHHEVLPQGLIEAITQRHRAWLARCGYLTS